MKINNRESYNQLYKEEKTSGGGERLRGGCVC